MLLSDERFACATVATVDGERRELLFDDIGDQIEYEKASPAIVVQSRWVHDMKTRQWLKASEALFARAPGLHTPMGSGIAAFASRTDAEAVLAEHPGVIVDWNQLVPLHLARHASTAPGN
jgi:nitrous oxide reductase accessory protein NosL